MPRHPVGSGPARPACYEAQLPEYPIPALLGDVRKKLLCWNFAAVSRAHIVATEPLRRCRPTHVWGSTPAAGVVEH